MENDEGEFGKMGEKEGVSFSSFSLLFFFFFKHLQHGVILHNKSVASLVEMNNLQFNKDIHRETEG